MLSVMLNELNYDKTFAADCVCMLGTSTGVSSGAAAAFENDFGEKARATLYDAGLQLDSMRDAEWESALDAARKFGARQIVLSAGHSCDTGRDEAPWCDTLGRLNRASAASGIELLITNRRRFIKTLPVSAEKLMRLTTRCEVRIAYDFGFAHAYGTALENLYDLMHNTAVICLNDNFGMQADDKTADWINGEIMYTDERKQPGYGDAPFVGMAEAMRSEDLDIPLYINGARQGDADLKTLLTETKVILSGKVFLSPAQARIGRNEHGRIIL